LFCLLYFYSLLLSARDRDVLVPDPARQKAIWRPIGNPGTVLADGRIAGTWKATKGPKSTLAVGVTPFGRLPAAVRPALTAEAERLAVLRGLTRATLSIG